MPMTRSDVGDGLLGGNLSSLMFQGYGFWSSHFGDVQ